MRIPHDIGHSIANISGSSCSTTMHTRMCDAITDKVERARAAGVAAGFRAVRADGDPLRNDDVVAHCTAACLERAKSASKPATWLACSCKTLIGRPQEEGREPTCPKANRFRREPVAPWVRLKTPGFIDGELPGKRQRWSCGCADTHDARYANPDGSGACDKCADLLGVFGSVDIAAPPPAGPVEPWPQPPCGPVTPVCAGPLAVHGTPVLRVVGLARGHGKALPFCDACYLHVEEEIAAGYRFRDEMNAAMAEDSRPPARIGIVPQSIGPGAGIGVWASRGMRNGI